MLSKEEFIKTLEFIKDTRVKENKFVETLELLSPNTYCDCYLYGEYEDKLINVLESMFEDSCNDISYFIYDCNGLDNKYFDVKRCPKEKGKYLYKSIETLYDYLISNMGEKCDPNHTL